MSGSEEQNTQEKKGRKAVTRTDSEARKKKVEEKKAKQKPEFNQVMVIEAQADNLESRQMFGKKLIPITGFLKNMTVKIPKVPMPVTLHVLSEMGPHKRRDSFELDSGLTRLSEQVEISAGTVLKFSVEFEGEHNLEEVYLSGILAIK